MIFELTHRPPETDCLGMTLSEARELEEWEAQGLLQRLRAMQKMTAAAKEGKHSLGGIDGEDLEEVFSRDGTEEELG